MSWSLMTDLTPYSTYLPSGSVLVSREIELPSGTLLKSKTAHTPVSRCVD